MRKSRFTEGQLDAPPEQAGQLAAVERVDDFGRVGRDARGPKSIPCVHLSREVGVGVARAVAARDESGCG